MLSNIKHQYLTPRHDVLIFAECLKCNGRCDISQSASRAAETNIHIKNYGIGRNSVLIHFLRKAMDIWCRLFQPFKHSLYCLLPLSKLMRGTCWGMLFNLRSALSCFMRIRRGMPIFRPQDDQTWS